MFNMLYSEPHGTPQPWHCDYKAHRFTELKPYERPLGGLLALSEGAYLRVIINQKEWHVQIPPGYALFFRHDIVHSGGAYSIGNWRLHAYIALGHNQHPDNKTDAYTDDQVEEVKHVQELYGMQPKPPVVKETISGGGSNLDTSTNILPSLAQGTRSRGKKPVPRFDPST